MNRKTKYSENIETEPNIGLRIIAGLLDYLVIGIFFYAYLYAFGEPDNLGKYTVNGLPALVPILFWGIITIGLEQLFGSTFGNFMVGLKPLSINGINRELTFGQSLRRHLLDPIDMSIFGVIGILLIRKTEKNQRMGDIWAETIVVKIRKFEN